MACQLRSSLTVVWLFDSPVPGTVLLGLSLQTCAVEAQTVADIKARVSQLVCWNRPGGEVMPLLSFVTVASSLGDSVYLWVPLPHAASCRTRKRHHKVCSLSSKYTRGN